MSLRDRLVCGLKDSNIQKRLLQEPNLTLENATATALAMEAVSRDAEEIHQPTTTHAEKIQLHKLSTSKPVEKIKSIGKSSSIPCQSCGKRNHSRPDCYFRDATCNKCKKKGHIQKACRSIGSLNTNRGPPKKFFQNKQLEEQHILEMNHIGGSTEKIMVDIVLDSVQTQMELDTGSALSIMTINDYKSIFNKRPSLRQTNVSLKTYTGEIVRPLGRLK